MKAIDILHFGLGAGFGLKIGAVFPMQPLSEESFTRASVAYTQDKNLLLKEKAINEPRQYFTSADCPPLLLEREAENLNPFSNDFTQSFWIKSALELQNYKDVAPDGTKTADVFKVLDEGSNDLATEQLTVTPGVKYFFNFYLKTDSVAPILFTVGSDTGNITVTIQKSDGWVRVETDSTDSDTINQFGISSDTENITYSIWGANISQQDISTPIKTNGLTELRNADNLVLTIPPLTRDEVVLKLNFTSFKTPDNQYILLTDIAEDTYCGFRLQADDKIYFVWAKGGTTGEQEIQSTIAVARNLNKTSIYLYGNKAVLSFGVKQIKIDLTVTFDKDDFKKIIFRKQKLSIERFQGFMNVVDVYNYPVSDTDLIKLAELT